MTLSIQDVYRRYLGREYSLEQLRDWLALNQWELPIHDRELADEADVALVHLDDGYGTERDLRARLSSVFDQYVHTSGSMEINIAQPAAPAGGGVILVAVSGVATNTRTRSVKLVAA